MSVEIEFKLDEPVCPTCGKKFSSTHRVKTHHSIKHEQKLPNWVCCSCNSEFYNHNPRELCDNCIDNLYECPTCGEEFLSDNGSVTVTKSSNKQQQTVTNSNRFITNQSL